MSDPERLGDTGEFSRWERAVAYGDDEVESSFTVGDPRGVFYDLEKTPAEAEILTVRAHLMWELKQTIQSNGWSRMRAAKELNVTPSRLDRLFDESISVFTIEELVGMGAGIGLTVRPVQLEIVEGQEK